MTLVFLLRRGHCNVVVSNDLMGGSSYHARQYYYTNVIQDHQELRSLLTWNGPETRQNDGKEILLSMKEGGHYQTGRENQVLGLIFSDLLHNNVLKCLKNVSFYKMASEASNVSFYSLKSVFVFLRQNIAILDVKIQMRHFCWFSNTVFIHTFDIHFWCSKEQRICRVFFFNYNNFQKVGKELRQPQLNRAEKLSSS